MTLPVHYQVVGEEDYSLVINIDHDGRYTVETGSYTTEKPRSGQLSEEQGEAISAALHDLDTPEEHAMPEGAADAFHARLTVGEGDDAITYRFWEGALEEDPKLEKLIRLIETI